MLKSLTSPFQSEPKSGTPPTRPKKSFAPSSSKLWDKVMLAEDSKLSKKRMGPRVATGVEGLTMVISNDTPVRSVVLALQSAVVHQNTTS